MEKDKESFKPRECVACNRIDRPSVIFHCKGPAKHSLCGSCIDSAITTALEGLRISSSGDPFCSCCDYVFAMEDVHRYLESRTMKLYKEKFGQMQESKFQAEQRVNVANQEIIAGITKKCPKCFLPWSEPIACKHVTCHRNLGGCGYEWCWECSCEYKAVNGTIPHRAECSINDVENWLL